MEHFPTHVAPPGPQSLGAARRWSGVRVITAGAAIAWSILLVVQFSLLSAYSNAPGATGASAGQWPRESGLVRDPDRHTLVMLVHPRCPCSRPSLAELAKIMARCPGRLTAYVLFVRPAGLPDDWEKTHLWDRAAAIAGVTAVSDASGVEAERFGAATSGQVLLYDSAGRLVFRGGITAARGHFGDNAGEDAVVSLVLGQDPQRSATFVFGCPLAGSAPNRATEGP